MTTLDTPCIGICSTVYGDNVCRGCKRFFDEIIVWNAKDDIEKQVVFDRLNDLIVEVTKNVITIIDADLLKQSIKALKIRHREEQNPLCWAYYILREVGCDVEQYGFSSRESFKIIDEKLFELSQQLFKAKK